ncbi:MAG: TlpA disulfide reductase family protein [Bacteroidota bacterium]
MKNTKLFFSSSSYLAVLTFVLAIVFSCGSEKEKSNYQIHGKITNGKGLMFLLVNMNTSQMEVIDSVIANENGEFYFLKKVPEKGFYNIKISQTDFATIILDSTEKLTFEADATNLAKTYKVSGSKDSEIFLKFNEQSEKNFKKVDVLKQKQDSIRKVFEVFLNTTKDSVSIDSLSKILEPTFNKFSEKIQKISDEHNVFLKKFIDENLGSFATLSAIQMMNLDENISYYEKVVDALTKKYPNMERLKGFYNYVQDAKRLSVGAMAPDITMNTPDGKPLSLSSLKGKIVLIDFWASWCKPCRADNPFVVKIYNKYKDKGFDIFSVSLDLNKKAWIEAIAKDKLSWKNHVSDLKQWNSPITKLYDFNAIPFTCLIDREGKIVGKKLRGPSLEEKIKELIN